MATENITVVGHRKAASGDQLVSKSQVRHPRIGMVVNGTRILTGLLSFSVESNNYFSADTWRAEIAVDALPAAFNAAFWEATASIEVQLLASLQTGQSLAMVVGGFVDEHDMDWDGETLSISGRDYTGALIDKLSNDKLTNQTSSQIATLFAERVGMTPQVTATTTPVGRYLNGQTDFMAEDISLWRILAFLAQQEGFDVYGIGKTLVFAPSVPDPSPLAVKYIAAGKGRTLGGNVVSLKTHHKKVLAQTVTVQVRSWNYQQKQPIISTFVSKKLNPTASSNGTSIPVASSGATITRAQAQSGTEATGPFYIIRRSGLTQDQADALAKQTLRDITSHERTAEFTGPAIIGIDPRRSVQLTGTGTVCDMTYPVKSISRKFDWEGGASMTVVARGGSPDEAIKL